jgi:hypothetical protein
VEKGRLVELLVPKESLGALSSRTWKDEWETEDGLESVEWKKVGNLEEEEAGQSELEARARWRNLVERNGCTIRQAVYGCSADNSSCGLRADRSVDGEDTRNDSDVEEIEAGTRVVAGNLLARD